METKQLNHYKVFLASSNELSAEREDFFQYTIKINKVLEKFGYQIDVEAWEFADPALPEKRSQDEYNKILKDCDECIVLFWRKVGKYSKEELEIAYKERFGEGKLSRLVVYFKDVKDGDIPKDKKGEKEFEKLKKVKNGFAKKHGEKFYASYRDIESVENDFLLFFIDKNVPSAKLSIQESKIMLDGEEMGNISNLSLAYNNKPYQKLNKEVSDLDNALRLLESTNSNNASIPLLKNQLSEKKKELQELENKLIDMAQTITRITSSDPDNEKVASAQKQFAEGNYCDALAILNREEILADVALCEKDFESTKKIADQAKDKYRASIETIVLRIQYLSVAKVENWFKECKELYEKAVFYARNCYNDGELANLLFDYAYFLQNYNQNKDSILVVYKEALGIYCKLYKTYPEIYISDVATTLDNMGSLHRKIEKYEDAELEYREALELRRKLAESSPETYLPEVASTLNNLGNLYRITNKYEESEKEFKEALKIRRRMLDLNPATYLHVAATLNNLGLLHNDIKKYAEAEKEYKEALKMFSRMTESNSEVYISDLAMTLNNLGNLYSVTNKHSEAEKGYKEALEKYRQLAKVTPEVYLPDVAMTLFNFARLKMGIEDFTDAEQMAQESLEKYQIMARLSPGAFNKNVEKVKELLKTIQRIQAEKK